MNVGISGLVHTRNAGATLGWALRSLASWVDEIVVVDMASTDHSVQVAQGLGARVVSHEPLGYADPARAAGVRACRHDWVMMLDADEVVPWPLAERLVSVAAGGTADCVRIAWANHSLGSPVRHGTLGPHADRHLRFFRRDALELTGEVHRYTRPRPGSQVLDLPVLPALSVLHLAHADVSDFVARADRYAKLEAQALHARGAGPRAARALYEAGRDFGRSYLHHHGHRDGWHGFYLAALLATCRLLVAAHLAQLAHVGDDRAARAAQALLAEDLLRAHPRRAGQAPAR